MRSGLEQAGPEGMRAGQPAARRCPALASAATTMPRTAASMSAGADRDDSMRAGQLPIDEQVTRFQAALGRTRPCCRVLGGAARMGLPGWYLVAGCLYQTVWNVVTGQPPEAGILDYDLAYFDDTDLSWDAEDAVIQAGDEVFAGLPVPVQIRNQARVHLWYEQKFGVPVPAARLDRGGDRHLRGYHRLHRSPPAARWPVADLRPARPRRCVQSRRPAQPGTRAPPRLRSQNRPVAASNGRASPSCPGRSHQQPRAIRHHGDRLSAAMTSDRSAAAWDAEYQAGRYAGGASRARSPRTS